MYNNKKGFWKNLNWKNFLLIALYMFIATLVVECVWNFIAKDPVSVLLTRSALLHRAFTAVIAGFLIYLLFLAMKRKNPD